MIENQKIKPARAIGQVGEALALEALPCTGHTRWTIWRKAEVVAALKAGLLTTREACERYSLTTEEIALWHSSVDRSGMQGLRVTRIQHYRDKYKAQDHARFQQSFDSGACV
jgi:hypothetical protein